MKTDQRDQTDELSSDKNGILGELGGLGCFMPEFLNPEAQMKKTLSAILGLNRIIRIAIFLLSIVVLLQIVILYKLYL